MNYQYMQTIKLLQTIIYLCVLIDHVKNELNGTARCGKPAVPAQASLYQVCPARGRFDHNEKVIVNCKNDEFPNHKQELKCKNGKWTGKPARCGRHIEAHVIHFEIYDCKGGGNRLLVSTPINQSMDAPAEHSPLPRNSFHSMRVPIDMNIAANESTCYDWKIKFDRKVQIWFLLIDTYSPFTKDNEEMPILQPFVTKYRTCTLQKTIKQTIQPDVIVGYYYFCDINRESDAQTDQSNPIDTIMIRINTNAPKHIGLEAVFIGDVYTSSSGASQLMKPDCGQFEVQNIGVDFQQEIGHTFISCNDSFVDIRAKSSSTRVMPNGNLKHKLICNSNGQWVGEWPMCMPIKSCSKDEIIDGMSSSMDIEEVGNVYYVNESQWFAINDSWVRYTCNKKNQIMVGSSLRKCMKNGQWSHPMPYCTGVSISGFTIFGVLFTVIVLLALNAFVLYKMRENNQWSYQRHPTLEPITTNKDSFQLIATDI